MTDTTSLASLANRVALRSMGAVLVCSTLVIPIVCFVVGRWTGVLGSAPLLTELAPIVALVGMCAAPVVVVGACCVGGFVLRQVERACAGADAEGPSLVSVVGMRARQGAVMGSVILIGVTTVIAAFTMWPILLVMWPSQLMVLGLLVWWVPRSARRLALRMPDQAVADQPVVESIDR